MDELKITCDIKTRQVSKLRAQNVTLLNMATCGGESSSHVRRLEDLFDAERDKNKALLARIAELEEAAEAHPGINNLKLKPLPSQLLCQTELNTSLIFIASNILSESVSIPIELRHREPLMKGKIQYS
jgi:hypothetical protein